MTPHWISQQGSSHQKGSGCIETVCRVFECRPLNQRARVSRRKSRFNNQETRDEVCKKDKADGAHCPWESGRWQQLPRHDGKYDTSCDAPTGTHADCYRALLAKVCRHNCESGGKDAAIADSDAYAVCKKELPVARGHGGSVDADKLEHGADEKDVSKVASVCDASSKSPNKEEQERLQRSDPRNVRWRVVKKGLVVELKDTKRVDEAPGVHDDQVTAQN